MYAGRPYIWNILTACQVGTAPWVGGNLSLTQMTNLKTLKTLGILDMILILIYGYVCQVYLIVSNFESNTIYCIFHYGLAHSVELYDWILPFAFNICSQLRVMVFFAKSESEKSSRNTIWLMRSRIKNGRQHWIMGNVWELPVCVAFQLACLTPNAHFSELNIV